MTLEQKYIASTTLDHRKKYAQFFTPEKIAEFMCHWVLQGKQKLVFSNLHTAWEYFRVSSLKIRLCLSMPMRLIAEFLQVQLQHVPME